MYRKSYCSTPGVRGGIGTGVDVSKQYRRATPGVSGNVGVGVGVSKMFKCMFK